jgi:uncharacterized protein YecE (DUF72 family)
MGGQNTRRIPRREGSATTTHEKRLVDCQHEFTEFIDTMVLLGDKLGPLLLQFP